MAVSQSSVFPTVTVAAGRACGGHRPTVVVPETVFRTTGPSARSARASEPRRASGPSAVTAATRTSVNSTSATSPGASTGPRSSAASTSPRVSPAVRSSIRSSSSGVPGCRSCQARSSGVVYGPNADQACPSRSGQVRSRPESRASSKAATAAAALSRKATPSGVRARWWVERSTSRTPRCRSSAARVRDTAGWVSRRRAAARVMFNSSATARKARRCRSSTGRPVRGASFMRGEHNGSLIGISRNARVSIR